MSNSKFIRSAGWWAFASAVILILAFVALYIAPSVGEILTIVFFLSLSLIFYALYVVFRSGSKGLSLLGLLLAILAIVFSIAANLNEDNVTLSYLLYSILSLPFLIFGYLAFRSTRLSRGLAVVTLLTGVAYLISGVGGLLGSQSIFGTVSTLSTLLMLVWLFWFWRVFVSRKMAESLPEAAAA
jgi:hypothetical protein